VISVLPVLSFYVGARRSGDDNQQDEEAKKGEK
jgi:hypothetical protein